MALTIVEHTDERMLLKKSPRGTWILCAILVVAGLAFSLLSGEYNNFECTRDVASGEGICVVENTRFFRTSSTVIPMHDIQEAHLAEQYRSGTERMYRVEILRSSGSNVPLSDSYTTVRLSYEEYVTSINAFLADSQAQYIQIDEDTRYSGTCCGIFFIFAGIALLVISRAGTISLSAPDNRVLIRLRGLFGSETVDRKLDEIEEVRVQRLNPSRDSRNATYRIAFYFTDESVFPLTSYYSNGLKDKAAVVEKVNEFLRDLRSKSVDPVQDILNEILPAENDETPQEDEGNWW